MNMRVLSWRMLPVLALGAAVSISMVGARGAGGSAGDVRAAMIAMVHQPAREFGELHCVKIDDLRTGQAECLYYLLSEDQTFRGIGVLGIAPHEGAVPERIEIVEHLEREAVQTESVLVGNSTDVVVFEVPTEHGTGMNRSNYLCVGGVDGGVRHVLETKGDYAEGARGQCETSLIFDTLFSGPVSNGKSAVLLGYTEWFDADAKLHSAVKHTIFDFDGESSTYRLRKGFAEPSQP